MHLMYEDSGKFAVGRILSQSEQAWQVEVGSGKRQKVKASHGLITFDDGPPQQWLAQAQALAQTVDLDLAWSCAPEDDFDFAWLARDYFGEQATTLEQAAALLALHAAPHYFRRGGKGRFRKASAEVLQQALAAIAKRQAEQVQIDEWTEALVQGQCPAPVAQDVAKLLFKPDKNGAAYKALAAASKRLQRSALDVLRDAGAIANAYAFHWQRLVLQHRPTGLHWPSLPELPAEGELGLATVHAFSIDDSQTTEIDDAFSLQGLGSGEVTLGIHIAAPALSVRPNDAWDNAIRERMSTLYVPGGKVTMMPEALVQRHTLCAGRATPALSLYLRFQEDTLELLGHETRCERVPISHNLRHDQLDDVLDDAFFAQPDGVVPNNHAAHADVAPWLDALRWMHRLAQASYAQRMLARGKPQRLNRPDFAFALTGQTEALPNGDEQVTITERQRGAPLDLIVAEAMILANNTWGQWLADLGVPGIYRSQASLAPGVKVRMSTQALPHAGMGLSCYAWCTSPLRRYADLVNQWQLLACVEHGSTAALAAPFKPKQAELLGLIGGFEAAYAGLQQWQSALERYWTLRWLQQQGVQQANGHVIGDNLVRLETLPLVLEVPHLDGVARGTHVQLALGEPDLVALSVSASSLGILTNEHPSDEPDDDEPAAVASPLVVSVDTEPDDPQPTA
ncbi:MAG: ribonuclease catalytic domain-containing protein [Burkholderiaceae bacterium]